MKKSFHHYQDLIHLFNENFYYTENTMLVKGEDEPIYLPANITVSYHQVVFAHGFYASALHEISHWCIAGKRRRQLEDYGYWYEPDGRDESTQKAFEAVEKIPQALDWFFCIASNYPFHVSCDNLAGNFEPDREKFHQCVYYEALRMLEEDALPERAKIFIEALQKFYGTKMITSEDFTYPVYS